MKSLSYPGSRRPWQRKSIFYLVLSALCVTWTGLTFNSDMNLLKFLSTSIVTITLIFFVYGFDDLMDEEGVFYYSKNPQLRLLTFAALLVVVGSIFILGLTSFISASTIFLIGVVYSFRYKKEAMTIRIKSYFILKNILIGIGWGMLVFLGANQTKSTSVLLTFLFFSVQVMIGSIIRDLDDIDEDKNKSIFTFPVVLGLHKTALSLHLLNFLSAMILFSGLILVPGLTSLWSLWLIVVVYRFSMVEVIRYKHDNSFVLQQVNILACSLVFLGRMAHIWIF